MIFPTTTTNRSVAVLILLAAASSFCHPMVSAFVPSKSPPSVRSRYHPTLKAQQPAPRCNPTTTSTTTALSASMTINFDPATIASLEATAMKERTATATSVASSVEEIVMAQEEDNKVFQKTRISSLLTSKKFRAAAFALCLWVASTTTTATTLTPSALLGRYTASMIHNPLATKMATGASLAVLGDAMAQRRDASVSSSSDANNKATATTTTGWYDPRRALSFAAFDGCYRVFQHMAFPIIVSTCQGRLLHTILNNGLIGAGSSSVPLPLLAVLERTAAYQLGVIPLFYYPVFFTFTGILQGLSMQQTWARAKANFMTCWKRNLKFWIPIQLVMFGVVDDKWQIPFVCVMGILWSMILSASAGQVASTSASSASAAASKND